MGSFKTPRTGGNVVHRIDLGGGARRRSRPQRRSEARPRAARVGAAPDERAERVEVEDERDLIPAATPRPERRRAAEEAALDAPPAAAKDAAARRQIDLLERRLAKMSRLLEAKDQEVANRPARQGEDGIASVYREVQGLDGGGEEGQRKKALMSRIFEANLDLRKQIISG